MSEKYVLTAKVYNELDGSTRDASFVVSQSVVDQSLRMNNNDMNRAASYAAAKIFSGDEDYLRTSQAQLTKRGY